MTWRIMQGKQLIGRDGLTVASVGELVPNDHPAVLAHPDMASIAFMVEDAPKPVSQRAPRIEPQVEQPAAKRRPWPFAGGTKSDPTVEVSDD